MPVKHDSDVVAPPPGAHEGAAIDWSNGFGFTAAGRKRHPAPVRSSASNGIEWKADTGLQPYHRGQPESPFAGQRVHRVRIVRAPDGGQLRGCITGTKTIKTVGYPSSKMRCIRYGEGATEDARLIVEEVSTTVVAAIAQFCRIEALIGDTWHRAVPDGATLYADGRRAVIDCKRDWAGFRSRRNAKQAFLVELAAETLGWEYERFVLGMAGDAVRRENVDEIQSRRFVPVPMRLVAVAASALADGPMTLARLGALLHWDPASGRAMACSLMVKRVVEIELSQPLGPNSECRSVPPLPSFMPSLGRSG